MIATHCTCMYEHPGPELQLGDRTVTSGFPASQFAGWTELHVDTQLVLVLRAVRMPPMTCWLLAFILSATVTDINGQCGNDTTNSSYLAPGARNVFFSPDYPDPYPSDVYCRWLLETNEGYRLRLRSTQFQLRTSNNSCVDIFRVYDGDSVLSPLLYSSCNESFQPINSSSRYLLVTFTSGISHTESEEGFLVIYESFKYIVTTTTSTTSTTSTTTVLPTREAVQCGANNLTAEAGVYGYITSPGFPNAYPNDATCTWSIVADNSSLSAVRLDIVRIDLEFSPNCSFDSITIYDVFSTRREEVRRFCSYLEEPVVSRGLYLLVMFTSDSAFSGRGFQLRYTSVARPSSTSTTASTRSTSTLPKTTRPSVISVTPPSNDSECSSTPVSLSVSSGEVGYLQSLDYPYSSLNESECNWQISTDSNSVIKVTVQGLNLDLCSPCGDCDFLLIFDGRSVSNRSLGRVCNTYFQTVFYSTGPYLYLVMRIKAFSRGFRLRYEAVDVTRSPTPVTTLSTTTQQQPSSGTTQSSNVCSSSPVPLYVDYGQVRYLQSPNYPQNYFNNADCQWRIYTDNNLYIKVTVEDAHLEQCSVCGNCDFLEIFDGSSTLATKLGTVCDTNLQTVFYSSGPQLYLRLHTDSSVVSTGFRLQYELVAVTMFPTRVGIVSTSTISTSTLSKTTQQLFGGTTPSSNGTVCSSSPVPLYVYYGQVRYLQSPNYPQNYFNDADCQWRIYTDNIFYIKVTVEAANFEQCSVCGNCDYLEIFDGSSTLATKLGTVCDTSLQTVFYSSGPQLYLRLRTDSSVVFTGFRLRYEVVTTIPSPSPLCSSTFSSLTSSYGRQKLLRFESYANQRSSQTCSWVIRSDDASHVVRFSFDYFNMQDCSNGNCDCGYLDIFDGMSESSPQLLRLCGTKVMPLGSVSTGNSLYLTFNSRGTWKPKTFALQYESVARMVQSQPLFPGVAPPTSNACSTHPVRLKAKDISDRLVLSSSSLPQSSSINSYCDWLITSDPGYVIQLITFTVSSEYCTNCDCQRLDVFDGPTNSSMKLVVICSRITQPVTSTGQLMYIRFSAARNSGFSLLYHQMLQSEGLTDSSNSNSDRDFKLTGLVGGVLGVTLLFVTLALIFIFCYKRLSRKQKQTSKTSGNKGGDSRQSINPTALPTSDDEDTGLTSGPSTSDPPTSATSTSDPPTSAPPISEPPTSAPPISAPPTSAPYTSAPPTSVPPTSAPPTSVPTISASLSFVPPTSTSRTKKEKQTTKTRGKKRPASNHIPLNPTAPPANDEEDTEPTFAPPTSQYASSLYPNLSNSNQEDYIQAARSTGGTLAVPAAVPVVYYLETGRDNPAFVNDPSTAGDHTSPVYRGHSDV